MKIIKGDLIELAKAGEFDLICHGCNCQNNMGAGIAGQIRKEFPEAYEADLETKKGDRDKMGTIVPVLIERDGMELIVVNAYTQYKYGRGINVDYEALQSCFELMKEGFSGLRIGYPAIGAGLARGDWSRISGIIDEALDGEDHTFVEYEKKR